MSFLLDPYDNRDDGDTGTNHQDCPGEDELFVFGYACKLFRDDDKALLESSGQLLIPWMGDGSLMIDRYDLRNRLEDKGQFGLKPILPRRRTQEEDDLEEMLDKERYLSLGVDVPEHQLLEEESRKRRSEQRGGYQAVGFAYKESAVAPPNHAVTSSLPLRRPEHPPTSTVDVAGTEAERFLPPLGLDIPGHIQQPVTRKLHSIIERTAGFVARQGTQMEIMIKAKQKHNPLFSFLSLYDPLHSYYRLLLQMIASGGYTPVVTEEVEKGGGGERREPEKEGEEEVSDSGDSDDEGFELHPLLRVSTTPRSSPRPPATNTSTNSCSPSNEVSSKTSPPPSIVTTTATQSSSFSKSLSSVNAAPSLDTEQGGAWQPVDHTHYPRPSLESQQYPTEMAPDGGQHYPQYNPTNEGYSLHPQPSDFASQSNLEAYYLRLRADHLQSKVAPVPSGTVTFTPPPGRRDPGPPPPPPDLQPIVDKTAEYVARNSEGFERTVLERHCGDPKFGFLNPWDQYYPYYKFRLHMNKEKAAEEALAAVKLNRRQRGEAQWGKQVQKLSHSGSVSFKLTPKEKRSALETGGVDLGPPAEDEEEEEEEGDDPVIMQQERFQNVYAGGRGGGEDNLYGADGGAYQTVAQVYYGSGHAHYTSEGMAYSGNGELVEEGEGAPPTKRAKTNADIAVMDNKVQEFLSQVKAVLDT